MPKKNPETLVQKPVDRPLSSADVMALEIGSKVFMCGTDSEGRQRRTECTVAGLPQKKFLTYRDSSGNIRKCAIREYPNKTYVKVIGG